MYYPEDEEKTENGENLSGMSEKKPGSETFADVEPETPDFDEPENNGDASFDGDESEKTDDFTFDEEAEQAVDETEPDDTGIGEAPMAMPAKKSDEPFILDSVSGARKPKRRAKKKNDGGVTISTGALVVLLLCIVIFAAVIGIGGMKIYEYARGSEPTSTTPTGSGKPTLPTSESTADIVPIVPSGSVEPEISGAIISPDDTRTSNTTTAETKLIADCYESCVEIEIYYSGKHIGSGSGVIYTKDGYIITNYHVVGRTDLSGYTVLVRLSDGSTYEAQYVCGDMETDITVIKIDKNDCHAAKIGNSNTTIIGEWVYVIGNPNGDGLSVTDGRISARGRDGRVQSDSITIEMNDMFLISAPVNAGNSGGGLFNINGELIGIVNAKCYYDDGGNTTEGTAFAIPISNAIDCIYVLGVNNGYIPGRAKLGVTVNLNGKTISSGWSSITYSAYVTEVSENTSASLAGIQVGDIITKVGGVDLVQYANQNSLLSDYDALHMILLTYSTGDSTTITVLRPSTGTNPYGYQVTTYTEVELDLTFVDFNYSK